MEKLNIYLASSWNNEVYTKIRDLIRDNNFNVYDWRSPEESFSFHWSSIDKNYKDWNLEEYITALSHPNAIKGFKYDRDHYFNCDIGVLLLPSGASSHIEYGYIRGQGKPGIIYIPSNYHKIDDERINYWKPELIYKESNCILTKEEDLILALNAIRKDIINESN